MFHLTENPAGVPNCRIAKKQQVWVCGEALCRLTIELLG
jgi:hypothetical protein